MHKIFSAFYLLHNAISLRIVTRNFEKHFCFSSLIYYHCFQPWKAKLGAITICKSYPHVHLTQEHLTPIRMQGSIQTQVQYINSHYDYCNYSQSNCNQPTGMASNLWQRPKISTECGWVLQRFVAKEAFECGLCLCPWLVSSMWSIEFLGVGDVMVKKTCDFPIIRWTFSAGYCDEDARLLVGIGDCVSVQKPVC